MIFYMYGFDGKDPDGSMGELKGRGFTAVVAGSFDERALEALYKHDLDGYCCFGAFPLSATAGEEAFLSKDIDFMPRRWFSSGCPNEKILWERGFERAIGSLKKEGLKGVFSDGARFASFASGEDIMSFFTCFCERCEKKAEALGMDFHRMRREAQKALDVLNARGDFKEFMSVMDGDWMEFRSRCTEQYFEEMGRRIKEKNRNNKWGAFVFTPSLAPFVGQSQRVGKSLDIYAPMIYRKYPFDRGPACLDHEWHALLSRLGCVDGIEKYTGYELPESRDILKEGFSVSAVGLETGKAVELMGDGDRVMPIIYLEDENLKDCIREVHGAKAGGCGFFVYKKEHIKYLPDLDPFL